MYVQERGPDPEGGPRNRRQSDPLMTAQEVALLLRVTPGWIYAATRRNSLPHVRLGRYVRYRRSAIEAWMASVEQGPS